MGSGCECFFPPERVWSLLGRAFYWVAWLFSSTDITKTKHVRTSESWQSRLGEVVKQAVCLTRFGVYPSLAKGQTGKSVPQIGNTIKNELEFQHRRSFFLYIQFHDESLAVSVRILKILDGINPVLHVLPAGKDEDKFR